MGVGVKIDITGRNTPRVRVSRASARCKSTRALPALMPQRRGDLIGAEALDVAQPEDSLLRRRTRPVV